MKIQTEFDINDEKLEEKIEMLVKETAVEFIKDAMMPEIEKQVKRCLNSYSASSLVDKFVRDTFNYRMSQATTDTFNLWWRGAQRKLDQREEDAMRAGFALAMSVESGARDEEILENIYTNVADSIAEKIKFDSRLLEKITKEIADAMKGGNK